MRPLVTVLPRPKMSSTGSYLLLRSVRSTDLVVAAGDVNTKLSNFREQNGISEADIPSQSIGPITKTASSKSVLTTGCS